MIRKMSSFIHSLVHLWFDPEQNVTSNFILLSEATWIGYSRKKSLEKSNGRNPFYGLLCNFGITAKGGPLQTRFLGIKILENESV